MHTKQKKLGGRINQISRMRIRILRVIYTLRVIPALDHHLYQHYSLTQKWTKCNIKTIHKLGTQ